jgi:hypothetical protein
MAHKGQRTTKHREKQYPHAVDIPIPRDGLGQKLNDIHDAAKACPGGAEAWGFGTRLEDGTPLRWMRVGTMTPDDADAIAERLTGIGARRVR